MVFVSATRLRLRSPLYLPMFLWHTFLTRQQIINLPGFLGGKLLADRNLAYWTLTVWEEKAAMQMVRKKGAHKQVMPKIQDWCDESAFVHWRQETEEIPSFAEVHQKMMTEGIFTQLSQPSSAHLHKQIPAPKSSKLSGLWLRPKK